MVLANSQKQFLLQIESYPVYEKEHKVGHCHQLCLLLVVFVVSTLKECKTIDFSVFVGISFAIAFKRKETGLWVE